MRVIRADRLAGIALAVLALLGAAAIEGAGSAAATSAQCSGGGLEIESQAGGCGPEASAARASRGRVVKRYGRIVDTDNAYGDGQFHVASGRAFCKRGERVLNGGKQVIAVTGLFGGPARTAAIEDAPLVGKKRGWSIAFESDLGGLGRRDFRVVVTCER
jgi:hypothetical protein